MLALRSLSRKVSPSTIVLLKNDLAESIPLLPLIPDKFPTTSKITVKGSDAEYAFTFGGGSARLFSTYTVASAGRHCYCARTVAQVI